MKRRIKKALSIVVIISMVICLSACNRKKDEQETVPKEALAMRESQISSLLLPTESSDVNLLEDIEELTGEEPIQKESPAKSVSDKIYDLTSYEVLAEYEDHCEVKVTAPDMKKMFNSIQAETKECTEQELLGIISERLDSGNYDLLEGNYDLPITNGQVELTVEFLDAMSGGLFSLTEEYAG